MEDCETTYVETEFGYLEMHAGNSHISGYAGKPLGICPGPAMKMETVVLSDGSKDYQFVLAGKGF